MASGGSGAPSGAAAGSWHVRLARIEELEARLGMAELERDPYAESDSYLIRVQRLEARISELTSESEARLGLIRRLEHEIAELISGRNQRDALIQDLTAQVTSLRATRDDLERLLARQEERMTDLSSEVADARTLRLSLESQVFAQAARIDQLKRSRPRLRTQLADYARGAINRAGRRVINVCRRLMGGGVSPTPPARQTSGPAEQRT